MWGVVEKASPEMKPQLKVVGLPFPVEPGGASNSIHIAAKADAKKKDAVWNFIVLAASPEWQRAYGLTGSPAPRKNALTAADYAANPHLKVINEVAAKAQNLFPTNAAARAGYNDFATQVTKAGMRMISSQEPTAKVLADLQKELERALPL